ncbi:hypothetical protein BH11ACT3_BH11ACT3_23760 [soil metagenome]
MSRFWPIAAIVAQVLFSLTWLLAPLWQGNGYRVAAHSISDMYADTAPAGLLLVVVFSVCGLITILFSVISVRAALAPAGWLAWVGALLLAASIFGLGDLLSPFERLACRIADPGCTAADQVSTPGGALDSTLSTIGVVFLIVATFFLASAMARTPDWRTAVFPARVVGVALAALLLLSAVVGLDDSRIGGLLERGIALLGAAGISALAVLVLRRAPLRGRAALGDPRDGA